MRNILLFHSLYTNIGFSWGHFSFKHIQHSVIDQVIRSIVKELSILYICISTRLKRPFIISNDWIVVFFLQRFKHFPSFSLAFIRYGSTNFVCDNRRSKSLLISIKILIAYTFLKFIFIWNSCLENFWISIEKDGLRSITKLKRRSSFIIDNIIRYHWKT